MKWLIPVIALCSFGTQAQTNSQDLNEQWAAFTIATTNVQRALAALVKEDEADKAKAAEMEGRLKWVLNNWVRKK